MKDWGSQCDLEVISRYLEKFTISDIQVAGVYIWLSPARFHQDLSLYRAPLAVMNVPCITLSDCVSLWGYLTADIFIRFTFLSFWVFYNNNNNNISGSVFIFLLISKTLEWRLDNFKKSTETSFYILYLNNNFMIPLLVYLWRLIILTFIEWIKEYFSFCNL